MSRPLALASLVLLALLASSGSGGPVRLARAGEEGKRSPTPVPVPVDLLVVDDGDSVWIRWPREPGTAEDSPQGEVVRLLGVDAPETLHPEHGIPYAQPFGDEAAGFLRGVLATADEVTLLRSGEKDPYGRTLGYVFADGRNVSVLLIEARLAIETVSHFGDNGLPVEAARVREAAARQGPVAFEEPYRYRARMRKVAAWLERRSGPAAGADDGADR